MCPQCAQKLFHKKIKALRRQQEEEEADRRKSGRRAKHGTNPGNSSYSGSIVGKGSKSVEADRSDRRSSDPDHTSEAGFDAKEGAPAPGCDSSLNEGHALVLRAVAAAGGGGGPSKTTDQPRFKRLRPSRWSDPVDAPAKAGRQESTADGLDGVTSQAGLAVGDASNESASRRAWVGELEKDRTAEVEMDEYLSSLFL